MNDAKNRFTSFKRVMQLSVVYLTCATFNVCFAADEDKNAKASEVRQENERQGENNSVAEMPQKQAPTLRYNPSGAQLESRQQKHILNSLPAQTSWLDTQAGKFAIVWSPDTTGKPFGAVLLLHDAGQTLHWPSSLKNMHENLPDFGWSILSLALPNPRPASVPQKSVPEPATQTPISEEEQTGAQKEKDEKYDAKLEKDIVHSEKEEPQSEKPVAAPEDAETQTPEEPAGVEPITQERIAAAIDYLHQQGQYNIVLIGEGLGAARAVKFLSKTLTKSSPAGAERAFRALVLINPKHSIPEFDDFALTNHFYFGEMPTLDISFEPSRDASFLIKSRKKSASKARVSTYIQRRILSPIAPPDTQENRLTRMIRGFLQNHAKGVEVGG